MIINDILSKKNNPDLKTKKIILSYILNKTFPEISLNKQMRIKRIEYAKYKKIEQGLLTGKPLQYLIKSANFYGYDFYVNKNVLIPRPETELLVYKTNELIKKYFDKDLSILDIGTGSGNIAITLKILNKEAYVTGSDISLKALKVAEKNSKRLKTSIKLIQDDILEYNKEKYDVIISNPPYINKNGDYIETKVLKNEPHLALFAKENGLEFYKKILKTARKNLKKKSIIALEIGSNQKEDITKIIKKYFVKSKIKYYQDDNDFDRVIIILNNIE